MVLVFGKGILPAYSTNVAHMTVYLLNTKLIGYVMCYVGNPSIKDILSIDEESDNEQREKKNGTNYQPHWIKE